MFCIKSFLKLKFRCFQKILWWTWFCFKLEIRSWVLLMQQLHKVTAKPPPLNMMNDLIGGNLMMLSLGQSLCDNVISIDMNTDESSVVKKSFNHLRLVLFLFLFFYYIFVFCCCYCFVLFFLVFVVVYFLWNFFPEHFSSNLYLIPMLLH